MNKIMELIKKSPILFGVIGVLVVTAIYLIGQYNSFMVMNNAIDGQWKQVEVQYQRRFDLIPNLVEATKGIMKQEQEVFTAIAEARTRYAGAPTVDQKAEAAGELEGALSRLLVIMENYPQLKSDQSVLKLQDELAGTENRIAVERRRYNEIVQAFNTKLSIFPTNMVGKLFGFNMRAYFNAAEGAEKAPEVKF